MIRSLGQTILYMLMVNQLLRKHLQTQENQNNVMKLITVTVSKWCTTLVAAWWMWHVWAWQGELRHTHTPHNTHTHTQTHTHTHTHQYSCWVAEIHQKHASFAGRGIRNLMLTDCQSGLASQEKQHAVSVQYSRWNYLWNNILCLNSRSMYCFSHLAVFAANSPG